MGRKKKSPPPSFATAETWHTHYVVLFDDLLNSPAYIALSAAAKEAYTILMQEYKGIYTGDKIVCPYSTFTSKGMRTNTVSRALMMLERFGFIKVEEHGGLERRPNVYRLIDGWKSVRTAEEAKEIKKAFENDLRQQKKAKTNITPYGIDISPAETDSCNTEKTEEITIESDSENTKSDGTQQTKPLVAQLAKPLTITDLELLLRLLPAAKTGLAHSPSKRIAAYRAQETEPLVIGTPHKDRIMQPLRVN